LAHPCLADPGRPQACHGVLQAAARRCILPQEAGAPAAVLVAVFRDIGQVQIVGEGAHHGIGFIGRELLEAPFQRTAIGGVAVAPEPHGHAAYGFYGVEYAGAFAGADDVA